MKNFILLFIGMIGYAHFGFTQPIVTPAPAAPDNYISPNAFRKMMMDEYRLTIIGGQSPASGFKVDITKPSITLKGNIFPKNYSPFLMNLELEGGLDNGLMQLVGGKKVSNYFKTTVGFNYMFPRYNAFYNKLSITEKLMTQHAIAKQQRMLTSQMDTFMVIKVITDDTGFHNYTFERFRDEVYDNCVQHLRQLDGYARRAQNSGNNDRNRIRNLIIGVLRAYGVDTTGTEDVILDRFKTSIYNHTADNQTTSKKLLDDYDRLYDLLEKDRNVFNNRLYDFEIALTKFNWNVKKIEWINVSFIGMNNAFWLYNGQKQSLSDTSQFAMGLSASYNWLTRWKEPGRYLYIRTGAVFQKANNLHELDKFTYTKEAVINVGPEVLTKKKEGVAYVGELEQDFGIDVFFEGYMAPWKNGTIPGLYVKPVFRHSSAWLNKTKIALDLGIVWNINSSDKDAKNLLSIVPYVSWSNLLPEYKDATKMETKKTSDLFSFNIKFGVPINIGK